MLFLFIFPYTILTLKLLVCFLAIQYSKRYLLYRLARREMAVEELQIIRLKKDFNKDGFRKILFILGVLIAAVVLLIATSLYLLLNVPAPVKFSTDNEWRIVKPVPVEKPYLAQSDLVQWVSDVLPKLFNYDFINYKSELQKNEQYFTGNGWKKFLGVLNTYAAYTLVDSAKLFITSNADGAPFVVNQGLLGGRYSWWMQMPVKINYSAGQIQTLDLQVLVVRVSTLDNLYGVEIENMLVLEKGKPVESQVVSQ